MKIVKEKIKKILLYIKLKLKYKNFNLVIGNNVFISTKSKIILGENSKLIIKDNSYISDYTRIIVHDNSKLIIEKNVYISINSIISSNSEVIIGEDTQIAHNVTILDTNKVFDNVNIKIREQGYISKPIVIGEDCWIAAGVIVLPGVTLGRHCIVGANSVVNKQFDNNVVIAGTPARKIRDL